MRSPRLTAVFAMTALSCALAVPLVSASADVSVETGPGDVEFICENDGNGLSAVDVLMATGEHGVFLDYLQTYDPEGYEILTDPALADKTIWAPTDDAFAKLGDAPEQATPAEIKNVLGFHITPPRRTVEGDYPIITFAVLADESPMIHQTRTGILTDSDQRVTTRYENGIYTVQESTIRSRAYCTQAGSIFSIDEVITEVAIPGWLERTLGLVIYTLFFQYPLLIAIAVLVILGLVIWFVIRRWRLRAGGSPAA